MSTSGSSAPAARSAFAVRLLGEVLSPPDFAQAAAACVTVLAQHLGFDRVSFGIPESGGYRVIARSQAIAPDALADANLAVARAMAEAMDQAVSIVVTESSAPYELLTRAHAALLRHAAGLAATVPIAVQGEVVGAMTLQNFRPRSLSSDELAELESLAAMLAPALRLMLLNERSWWRRVRDDWQRWRSQLAAEEAGRVRLGLAVGAVVAGSVLLLPLEHHIGAQARIEGEVQRALVAPTDGYLGIAHVRAGDHVATGQILAELVDRDLLLERDRWASQLNQHQTRYATAMSRTDRPEAALQLARAAEAQAELALAESSLNRSQIVAPFDGVVIQGDLSQLEGAPIKQGDTLFTIAPANRYRLIVEVDERDVNSVRVGQVGKLALSALPWDTLAIEVVRLTPMATPIGDRNVFEAEAQLLMQAEDLRPGLRGTARIVVGRQPLLWTWTSRIAGRIRLALWRWLA